MLRCVRRLGALRPHESHCASVSHKSDAVAWRWAIANSSKIPAHTCEGQHPPYTFQSIVVASLPNHPQNHRRRGYTPEPGVLCFWDTFLIVRNHTPCILRIYSRDLIKQVASLGGVEACMPTGGPARHLGAMSSCPFTRNFRKAGCDTSTAE